MLTAVLRCFFGMTSAMSERLAGITGASAAPTPMRAMMSEMKLDDIEQAAVSTLQVRDGDAEQRAPVHPVDQPTHRQHRQRIGRRIDGTGQQADLLVAQVKLQPARLGNHQERPGPIDRPHEVDQDQHAEDVPLVNAAAGGLAFARAHRGGSRPRGK